MKTMHLFAGVGGGLLCDLILGHTPIVAVEWEPYACKVLRERAADGWFPGLHVWEGDVRMFDPSEYTGRVDCIHAGFPCQPFSVAGARKGSEDERGDLFAQVLRCVEVVRPKHIFLENVPGLLTSKSPTCLCGWPYRRGGVHRDSVQEREVSRPGGDDRDVNQGGFITHSNANGIRRDDLQDKGQTGQVAGSAEMAYWRGKCGDFLGEDHAVLDAQETASGTGFETGEIEGQGLECGNDCRCGTDEEADAQPKPEGSRCPQCGRGLVSDSGLVWYMESVVWNLAALGYDTRWLCLRASDVGAPHHRDRWFLLANAISDGAHGGRECEIRTCSPDESTPTKWSNDDIQTQRRSKTVPNADSAQLQGNWSAIAAQQEHDPARGFGWWELEPALG